MTQYSRRAKVDACLIKILFFLHPLLVRNETWMKHTTSGRWLANPNWTCCHLPHNLQSSYEHLIWYESEDYVLIKWSYKIPSICSLLSIFWAYNPISTHVLLVFVFKATLHHSLRALDPCYTNRVIGQEARDGPSPLYTRLWKPKIPNK